MRVLLSGLPKSGLHLLEAMVAAVLPANRPVWASTFHDHAFSLQWTDLKQWRALMDGVPDGYYVKGHVGYAADVLETLRDGEWQHIFIRRDLRDVAVSQLHHILSDNPAWEHPDRDHYRFMADDRARLEAIMLGDERFAGVLKRWRMYRGWTNAPSTLVLDYERIIADRDGAAWRICKHLWPDDSLQSRVTNMVLMVANSRESLTLREGQPGAWDREYADLEVGHVL